MSFSHLFVLVGDWFYFFFNQEMMYVWNGFAIVGKRADLTENLLVTIEKEETALQNETSKWSIKVELIIL